MASQLRQDNVISTLEIVRLTIRVDELEGRVLAALQSDLMQPEVVEEYVRETNRLARERDGSRGQREAELKSVTAHIQRLKAAILKGVDPTLFTDELKQLGDRRKRLTADIEATALRVPEPALLHMDLGRVYREKVETLTGAFEDEALRAQAFERIRALIEAVVLTPRNGDLAIDLRGDLASMLELCAGPGTQKASAGRTEEALQIKMVAGSRSSSTRHSLLVVI